nr:cytochrome P450 1A1-like [Lytechinus pictus]
MIADLAHGVFDFGFSSILFGITTSLLVVWLMKWVSKRRKINRPPGPMTVPWPLHLIGDLVMLAQGTNPVVMLCELNKRYGDVVCLDNGGTRYVILASPEVVNEALVKQAEVTSGREEAWEFKAISQYHGKCPAIRCYPLLKPAHKPSAQNISKQASAQTQRTELSRYKPPYTVCVV